MIRRTFSPKPVITEKMHTTAHTVNVREVLSSNQSELFSAFFKQHTCDYYQCSVTLEHWKEVRNRNQFKCLAQPQTK